MTVITATGKEFEADLVVESTNPERLYVHIINSTVAEVATVFTSPSELPLVGYLGYTVFDSMNVTPTGGINVCLKKQS